MDVLIVDDSRAMRMIVVRTLKQTAIDISSVTEAGDGAEALPIASSRPFDVILTDWNMPRMNGLELLKSLRRAGVETPVGFCTSEATTEMRSLAIENGAAFFITKPFSAATLQAAMNKARG